MEKSEIMAIASQIAANCTTCKQVAERFEANVAKYGKEDAKAIQAQAKEFVKSSKLTTKAQASATIEFLKSNQVAKVAFNWYLDNDVNGEFAKMAITYRCDNSIDRYVTKYCSYYTEVDGICVVLNKSAKFDEDGNRVAGEYEFKPKRLDSAAGYISALKTSTKNCKRCELGASLSDVSKFIPADDVTWPEK